MCESKASYLIIFSKVFEAEVSKNAPNVPNIKAQVPATQHCAGRLYSQSGIEHLASSCCTILRAQASQQAHLQSLQQMLLLPVALLCFISSVS
mmetsp:Transcript_96512/g.191249  ORF Transcript_96512/g.191249 Transcript_96512/m.191249 type:complete len:93 (-) Transcript_96512:64-342(-)